jgi:3-hydroxypropanoate dehydrogenase
MTDTLDNLALDRLFRAARTHNAWFEQPVTEDPLRELYDLMTFGPTSGIARPDLSGFGVPKARPGL